MIDARILDEKIEGLSHTFRITVDAAPVRSAVDQRLQELRRTASAPGFRPGRVPVSLLRKRYASRLRATVVDQMAIDVARGLIADKKLEPSRRPTIHIDEDANNASATVGFTLVLEVMPQVQLGKLEGFRLRHLRVPGNDPELAAQSNEFLRRQLFDELLSSYDFPVPEDMVEEEYARIGRGFEVAVGEAVDAEVEAELRGIAVRRIRLAILLAEIGHAHGISVPRSEVEALVELQAERDPDHQAEIIDYYLDHPTALAELQSPLFEGRVVDFLLARSEIEDVDMGAEEFRQAIGPS